MLLTPKKDNILEHDGTERIKHEWIAMMLQFRIREGIEDEFKPMTNKVDK